VGGAVGVSADQEEIILGPVLAHPAFYPLQLMVGPQWAFVNVDRSGGVQKRWEGPNFYMGIAVPLW
jgi:hypothetical protein